MSHKCFWTGYSCIDPGHPTDCEANNFCLFVSLEQREEFEALPDKFEVEVVDLQGNTWKQRFKNGTQVTFFLADLPRGCHYRVHAFDINDIDWKQK